MVFYSDSKTLISNMLGTAINENVLVIHTVKEKYELNSRLEKMVPTTKHSIG